MAGIAPEDVDVVETYDDYPVIVMMQFEDLGFCAKGEGAGLRARARSDRGRRLSAQHQRRPALVRAGRRRGRPSRDRRGVAPGHRADTGQAVPERAARLVASGFGMINYDGGCAPARR